MNWQKLKNYWDITFSKLVNHQSRMQNLKSVKLIPKAVQLQWKNQQIQEIIMIAWKVNQVCIICLNKQWLVLALEIQTHVAILMMAMLIKILQWSNIPSCSFWSNIYSTLYTGFSSAYDKRCASKHFLEITEDEFNSVSSLVRGRVKLSDVNSVCIA